MHRRRFLASLAAGAAALAARRAGWAEALPVPAQVEALANGLRVVLSPERTIPTVAVAVYYDVGSRVEAQGRTGFAHLFEHMMFEGSENVGRGEHFRLISSHGGSFNGTTSEDRTNYYETLPAHALELGLWLEADRMRALDVSAARFENQRQTVMEERRQSYENAPYMLSYLRRDELAYEGYFPYSHSTIGDMRDLAAASLADVRAFHARYYAPDNAVLALAGDFDPAEALALARRHFDPIPARRAPAWRDPGFAGQAAARADTVVDPLARLPGFHVAWRIPPRRTPDHYALSLLALALGRGESSRLHQRLVRERELAARLEVDAEPRRGPALFTLWCELARGRTGPEARAVIDRELAALTRGGLAPRELDKVKNMKRAEMAAVVLDNLRRAQALAEHELYDGNALLLRTELDRYLAVTEADVQRVASRYLVTTNRTVIDVVRPPPAPPPSTPSGTPPSTPPSTPQDTPR